MIKAKHNPEIQSAVDNLDGSVQSNKELSRQVSRALPGQLLKGNKLRQVKGSRRKAERDTLDQIEDSYNQLTGEWGDWLETARAYDRAVPRQDQLDVRHNILLDLAHARARDNQPIPKRRQYRIASLCRINYWRERGKGQTRVCILDGIAKPLHCKDCDQKPKRGRCPWLAVRPILSLDVEVEDCDGETVTLADTIADDKAVDLESWQEPSTWLFGFPTRLVLIADKIRHDKTLTGAERTYLWKWRKREQKKLL